MRCAALAILLCAGTASARAEQSDEASAPLLVRFAPRPEQRERARTAQLEQRLTRLLEQLPDVEHAAVQLTLPAAAELPLDQPLPRPRAAVVLRFRADGPSESEVWKLVRSSVALAPSDLALVKRSAPALPGPPELVELGPFRVAVGSKTPLRWVLGLLLGSNAVLSTLLLRAKRARAPAKAKAAL